MKKKYLNSFELPNTIWLYLFSTAIINVIYIIGSVVIIHYHYLDINLFTREVSTILNRESAGIVFHSLVDILTLFYLLMNGTVSFFYLYLLQMLCKCIRFVVLETYVFHTNSTVILFFFFCLSLRIVNAVFWVRKSSFYLFKRNSAVCNGNVNGNSYYNVYYMLHGCSLNVLAKGMFNTFFVFYNWSNECNDEIINSFVTALIGYFTWHFLWLEKKYSKKKWYVIFFFSLNIIRFFIILIISGERRYFLNVINRNPTTMERLLYIITRTDPKRNYFLSFIDNLEKIVTDLAYNIYFTWYCILLWKKKIPETIPIKGRLSIENTPEDPIQPPTPNEPLKMY
ncbi:hypothetical protein NEOKW01_0559 [Nematocida sp. AWRm80]|nr:hypothetical protein NEOKW01_0559 [Nematocida sp. AWRm80]